MVRSSAKSGTSAAYPNRVAWPLPGQTRYRQMILAPLAIVLVLLFAGCAQPAPAPMAAATPAVQAPEPVAAATEPPTITPTEPPTAAAETGPATPPPAELTPSEPVATTELAPTAASAPPMAAVSFARDVLPIFEQNCVKCHGDQKTEKGLKLNNYARVMEGSEDGLVIIPGNAQDSLLVQLIVDGKMPRRAPRLRPEEIGAIAAWVDAGAPDN